MFNGNLPAGGFLHNPDDFIEAGPLPGGDVHDLAADILRNQQAQRSGKVINVDIVADAAAVRPHRERLLLQRLGDQNRDDPLPLAADLVAAVGIGRTQNQIVKLGFLQQPFQHLLGFRIQRHRMDDMR